MGNKTDIQDAWYDCDDCIFASNSLKEATKHQNNNPSHTVMEELEDDE